MRNLIGKDVNISQSYDWDMLETWDRCPLEYRIRYVDKGVISFPTGDEYFTSRILHACIYKILSLPPEMRGLKAVEAALDQTVDRLKIKIRKTKVDSLIVEIMRFLEMRVLRFPVFMSGLHLERTFGNIKLRTKVEYLGQEGRGYILLNFKMGHQARSSLNYSEDKLLQLWYTLFLMPAVFRQKVKSLGWYYFLDGKLHLLDFRSDLYVRAVARIQMMIQKFEDRSEYSPRINPLCPSCGHRHQCPAIFLEQSAVVRKVAGLAV